MGKVMDIDLFFTRKNYWNVLGLLLLVFSWRSSGWSLSLRAGRGKRKVFMRASLGVPKVHGRMLLLWVIIADCNSLIGQCYL